MTDTSEFLRDQLMSDIYLWIGDHPAEKYIFDKEWENSIEVWGSQMRVANKTGLKRIIGKELKNRGYRKICSSPPTWINTPPVPSVPNPAIIIPQYIQDIYLSLLQTQTIIEKEYPGIEKGLGL